MSEEVEPVGWTFGDPAFMMPMWYLAGRHLSWSFLTAPKGSRLHVRYSNGQRCTFTRRPALTD